MDRSSWRFARGNHAGCQKDYGVLDGVAHLERTDDSDLTSTRSRLSSSLRRAAVADATCHDIDVGVGIRCGPDRTSPTWRRIATVVLGPEREDRTPRARSAGTARLPPGSVHTAAQKRRSGPIGRRNSVRVRQCPCAARAGSAAGFRRLPGNPSAHCAGYRRPPRVASPLCAPGMACRSYAWLARRMCSASARSPKE